MLLLDCDLEQEKVIMVSSKIITSQRKCAALSQLARLNHVFPYKINDDIKRAIIS